MRLRTSNDGAARRASELSNLTADHAEGFSAFAERRDARFSGR